MIVLAVSEGTWFAVITVVAIIAVLAISASLAKKRAAALQKAAATLGFSFERKGAAFRKELNSGLHLLNLGRNVSLDNVMRSPDGLILFDYQYLEGEARSGRNITQTVAAFVFPAATLPDFHLGPDNLLRKVAGVFGYRSIRFDSHPDFDKRFALRGRDEAAVRALFVAPLLDYFQSLPAKPAWSVEGAGAWLLVYQAGKKVKPDELQAFVDAASSTARVIARAAGTLDLSQGSVTSKPRSISARAAIN
jgi:carbonic anhydrase